MRSIKRGGWRTDLLHGCVAIVLLLACTPSASAGEDTEPPVLASLAFSPATVNTTSSSRTVTVTAHITDNISGTQFATIAIFSPAHRQIEPSLSRISGTTTNGIYQATIELPVGSERGSWKARFRASDLTGNTRELDSAELSADEFPNAVRVEDAAQDTEAPVLERLAFSPATVNTTSSSRTVTVTAHITDNISGTQFATIAIFSPAHRQIEPSLSRISGTATNGIYQATIELPIGSEKGSWKARFAASDFTGNTRRLDAGGLAAHGFPNAVRVEDSTQDTEAPVLESLAFSPSTANTTSSSQTVTVTAHITDSVSGTQFATIGIFSPAKHQIEPSLFRISGTATNGIYQATIELPVGSEKGSWAARFRASDFTGNTRELDSAELAADGLPNTIEVEDF